MPSLLCYTDISTFFEIGASMKIHKTVNPVAYENTYYLEGDQHLIVVDPGSHWEAIRKITKIGRASCRERV